MFLEILSLTLLGITAGIFTGLIPGIHVNNVCVALLGFGSVFIAYDIPAHAVASFIIAMAVTHTVLDFIPSIFLGAPEGATALSVLPGHRLLLRGKGLEALYLTVLGGVWVTLIFVLLSPVLILALPAFYGAIKSYIHLILLAILVVMIATERKNRRWALLVVILSGILGLLLWDNPVAPLTILFFPLFTGLFGIPTLLVSLGEKSIIPPQESWIGVIDRDLVVSGVVKSFFSSLLVGTLPGVGASQATVMAQEITRKRDAREFLVSVGGINTAVAIFSILSLYTIDKARSGAAVAIGRFLEDFGLNELVLLISVALIAISVSSLLALFIGKRFLHLITRIPYHRISVFIIGMLVLLVLLITGPFGLLVLFTATSLGLVAPLTGIKRSHLMGVLLVPLIIFYAGVVI